MDKNEIVFEPYDLVEYNHPMLHTKLEQFDFANPPIDPIVLANRLIVTMNANSGLGLSANQCGLPYRVFVLRSEPVTVCFNPKILYFSNDIISLEEGCLSFPFLYLKIKRPNWIRARYTTALGETRADRFIGMTSRVFQHEYDHLEGINYQNRANRAHIDRAKRAQIKIQKRIKVVPKTLLKTNEIFKEQEFK